MRDSFPAVWVVHVNFFVGDTKTRAPTKNGLRHKGVISSLISCQVARLFQRTSRVFMKETKDKDHRSSHGHFSDASAQKRCDYFLIYFPVVGLPCNLFKCNKLRVWTFVLCKHVACKLRCNSEMHYRFCCFKAIWKV